MIEEYERLGRPMDGVMLDLEEAQTIVADHFEKNQGKRGKIAPPRLQTNTQLSPGQPNEQPAPFFIANFDTTNGRKWVLKLVDTASFTVFGEVSLPAMAPDSLGFYQVLVQDGELYFWAGGNSEAIHCNDFYNQELERMERQKAVEEERAAARERAAASRMLRGVAAKSPAFPGMTLMNAVPENTMVPVRLLAISLAASVLKLWVWAVTIFKNQNLRGGGDSSLRLPTAEDRSSRLQLLPPISLSKCVWPG